MRCLSVALLSLALLSAAPITAYAQDTLEAAKDAGLVGERPDGLVGYVANSVPAQVRQMVEQINGQRRQKYQDIAKKNGTAVPQVQAVAGRQLVDRTPSGQYVMNGSGQWVKK